MRSLDELHSLPDDALITPHELGEVLCVPSRLLAEHRMQGKGVPYEKIGHLVRYRMSDVRAYRDAQRRNTAQRKVVRRVP